MSELAEAEILRTRRPHQAGVMEVPPGLVTRHIKALAASNPRVAGKFKAFFEAVRGYFGLALKRAAVLEKGFRDGTLDRGKYDEHLDKVLGLGEHAGDVESKYGSDRSGMAILEGFGKLLGSFSLDDGSAGSRRQDEFVHKVWSALAQHDELFQYGRTTSKDAGEIAKVVSLPGMEVRAEDHGNWIGFEGKNGFLAVLDADTDRPYISSPLAESQGLEKGGGSQLYAAALDWIHNNGKKIKDDPGGLSDINAIRRTSNFFASALRWKTTKHLEPHADQQVNGWGEERLAISSRWRGRRSAMHSRLFPRPVTGLMTSREVNSGMETDETLPTTTSTEQSLGDDPANRESDFRLFVELCSRHPRLKSRSEESLRILWNTQFPESWIHRSIT